MLAMSSMFEIISTIHIIFFGNSLLKGTLRNLKNSRGRGVQTMALKQVSIEREVILEFKMEKIDK